MFAERNRRHIKNHKLAHTHRHTYLSVCWEPMKVAQSSHTHTHTTRWVCKLPEAWNDTGWKGLEGSGTGTGTACWAVIPEPRDELYLIMHMFSYRTYLKHGTVVAGQPFPLSTMAPPCLPCPRSGRRSQSETERERELLWQGGTITTATTGVGETATDSEFHYKQKHSQPSSGLPSQNPEKSPGTDVWLQKWKAPLVHRVWLFASDSTFTCFPPYQPSCFSKRVGSVSFFCVYVIFIPGNGRYLTWKQIKTNRTQVAQRDAGGSTDDMGHP